MKDNPTLLKEFLQFRHFNDLAPATVAKELKILRLFLNFIPCHLTEVTTQTINGYFSTIGHLSVRTIETRVIVIRTFFEYLTDTKAIQHNPALFLKCPKVPLKIPQIISPEETELLLASVTGNSFYDLRDRAILELIYGTGIRHGEIARLNLNDIDFDNKVILIYGKGDKERLIPLTDRVIESLSNYIRFGRPQQLKEPLACLWLNHYGTQLCETKFSRIVNVRAKRAGITKPVSYHTLRRSFATHLLQRGVNPYHIAKLLGHSDLKTIDHYLAVHVNDLKGLDL